MEDHAARSEGLSQILNEARDLMVCGTAGSIHEALPAIACTMPDLVLAELNLPGVRAFELITELRLLDRSVKLLVISVHHESLHAARAIRAGADGYILKQEDPDEIVDAIRDVLKGHIYISEEVMEGPQSGGQNWSFRQKHSTFGSSKRFRI